MYCPRCKGPVDANATVCPLCSADFSNPEGWHPTETPGAVTDKNNGLQFSVGAVLGVLVGVVVVVSLLAFFFSLATWR